MLIIAEKKDKVTKGTFSRLPLTTEASTEKISQFVMPQKSVNNKNIYFNNKNVLLNTGGKVKTIKHLHIFFLSVKKNILFNSVEVLFREEPLM
jgi:hypothetical protein